MSQEAVERVLGRLITDERFLSLAADSLETACLREGYRLLPSEARLLSGLEPQLIREFARQLNPGLCRADAPALKSNHEFDPHTQGEQHVQRRPKTGR